MEFEDICEVRDVIGDFEANKLLSAKEGWVILSTTSVANPDGDVYSFFSMGRLRNEDVALDKWE